MSLSRLRTYLVITVLVAVVALGATLAAGNEPVLGLDLQGGISVVYAPVGSFKPGALDTAVDIIRSRADGFGASESETSRQGDTITVDLPGLKNRDQARRVLGRTAELRFRPVIADVPTAKTSTTSTTKAGGSTTTTVPATTTTTLTANEQAAKAAVASCDPTQVLALPSIPTTRRGDDRRNSCVVLPLRRSAGGIKRLYLGPTRLTGSGVDSARRDFEQGTGYVVNVSFNDRGAKTFDSIAADSFPKPPPQNEVAIVLDGVIQSAPAFQASSFSGDVRISGSFSPDEASELAQIINYGALPVRLKELTVTNVAPTLGQDQLDAGIAAGVIGLLLVALYMLVYYRLLGGVVILGLLISGSLTYALISYMGQLSHPVVLTLAGVTGIIVSIGITVDSYVVYFERLKDEVRTGRTVRSSVDRGFTRSFRTIVAADLVSLLGALALYLIAIGSVKGFAFFLGISTLLDLVISYFFMHPLVSLMARRPELVRMRGVGIASGLDAPGVTA